MDASGTIAAVSTPPGPGGIAVVRISGEDARAVAAAVFRPENNAKNLEKMVGYSAAFGSLLFRGRSIDDGVALVFSAPHSYTGEDVVELSCHGGDVVSDEVLMACLEAGARLAQPGEFTKRAFMNGKLQLTQAEAVMDLISASSRQGAAAARAGMDGRLETEVCSIKEALLAEAAHLAAWIDYPEEDVEDVERGRLRENIAKQHVKVQRLVQEYDRGVALRRGVRAAIVGSPNVGKSTLFNVMAGYQRAIVTPVAGTTRDVLREEILVGGVPLHLTDTAGLHETQDIVEREGIRRSHEEMEMASLVIAVFDGTEEAGEEALALARQCQGKPSLCIINKSDLGTSLEKDRMMPYFSEVVVISALDGAAHEVVESAIVRILRLDGLDPDAAMLSGKRQLEAAIRAERALGETLEALDRQITYDITSLLLEEALQALAELSGESASESIIEEVFEQFCVGK